MAMPKIKNGKIKIFNLSKEEINLIGNFTRDQQFKSQSEFMGWLVRNYANTIDPLKEIEQIQEDKKRVGNQIKELELKEKQAYDKLKYFQETQKEREKSKKKAIEILKRKIRDGADQFELENIARYWAYRLNINFDELLFIVGSEFKRENEQKQPSRLKKQGYS